MFISIDPTISYRAIHHPQVYHPNINAEGEMTLDIFRYGNWSGAMTVHKLLLLIVSVLRDPMLDDHPTNDEANDVYESDLELFEQMAMAWTWEYSSTPIISYLPPVEKDERRLEVNGCVAAVARRSAREAERRKSGCAATRRRRAESNSASVSSRRSAPFSDRSRT